MSARDGFVDAWCGVELAVKDDCEAADFAGVIFGKGSESGRVIFVGNGLGNFPEALGPLVGHDEFDIEASVLGGVCVGVLDHAAAHFGDFFDEEARFINLTGFGVLGFEGHGNVADGLLIFRGGVWVEGAVDGMEGEFGGLFEAIEGVGVFLGVEAGELDFDGVVAHCTDDRFGYTEAVDALVNDVDGLGELLGFLKRFFAVESGVVDFKRKRGAACEIEAEFDFTLGSVEKMAQEDFIALVEVFDVGEVDFGEEGSKVDLLFFGNFREGDEEGGGLVGLNASFGLVNKLLELKWLSCGDGLYILGEGSIAHGEDVDSGPGEDDDGDDEFGEYIARHNELNEQELKSEKKITFELLLRLL